MTQYDWRRHTKQGKKERRQEYFEYLESAAWRQKRKLVFGRDGGKCVRCSVLLEPGWNCHHRTYKRIFNERLEDLEALCVPCHEAHHQAKPNPTRKRKKRKVATQAVSSPEKKKGHDGKKYLENLKKRYPSHPRRAKKKRGIIALNDELHERQVSAKRKRESRQEAA